MIALTAFLVPFAAQAVYDEFTAQVFEESARLFLAEVDNASAYYVRGDDLIWKENPKAWHQQMARTVDHRFTTFAELEEFALNAKKAGVSNLMLVQVQKTASCPGSWYGGLQVNNCAVVFS